MTDLVGRGRAQGRVQHKRGFLISFGLVTNPVMTQPSRLLRTTELPRISSCLEYRLAIIGICSTAALRIELFIAFCRFLLNRGPPPMRGGSISCLVSICSFVFRGITMSISVHIQTGLIDSGSVPSLEISKETLASP
jgi:hypothetical protein